MASSPTDSGTLSPRAFALQELAACWDQGYAALASGNLDQVASLLTLADEHLASLGTGDADTPREAEWRTAAAAAHARLQHGMAAGLEAVRDELSRARVGGKALRGYGAAAPRLGDQVIKDA